METIRCCGTCKYHKREVNEWICTNPESEYYADYTDYGDECEEQEDE